MRRALGLGSVAIVVSLVVTAACGGEGSTSASGGSAGAGAALGGGAGGGGGMGGGGGSGGGVGGVGGSGGGTSPGTSKLVFEVPTTKSYCVSTDSCSSVSSIAIKDAAGNPIVRWAGDCYTACDTCEMLPCPGRACMPEGKTVTGEALEWDGTHWQQGTCGADTSCKAKTYAAPGKYTAVMCATPGDISTDNNGFTQCTSTGPAECVEVPFDFPSTETFTGKLPG